MPDNIIELIISDIQNKNYSSAIQRLDELISSNPANYDLYEIKAGCNYALGKYEQAVDDWTYAIIHFKDALEHKKELSVIYNKRGRTYLKTGNYLNASEDFNKSRTLYPGSAETLNNLATCMRRLKNYDEALTYADKAIEINPEFSDAYNNRGNINYCMGNVNDAYNDYSSAIEHNPHNAKAYFNRGSVSFFLKDESNARSDWKIAVQLDEGIRKELEELHPEFSLEQEEVPEVQDELYQASDIITEPAEDTEQADQLTPPEEIVTLEHDAPQKEPEILKEEPEILKEEPEILKEEPAQIQEEPGIQHEEIESQQEVPGIQHEEIETQQEVQEVKKEELPVENYHDVFVDKEAGDISPAQSETVYQDDFEIPDFNFRTIFQENENNKEEVMEEHDEQTNNDKPLIPEEVQKLHEEIETPGMDSLTGFKGFDMDAGVEQEPEKETEPEPETKTEDIRYFHHDDEEQKAKNRLELIRSPVFLTILILGILFVAFVAVYQIIGTNRNKTVNTTKTDSQTVKPVQTADSLKETKDTTSVAKEEITADKEEETGKTEESAETNKKETVKEETTPPVKETIQQESVSQTVGYISDKKKFLLFSEKEGFFVQVGSYKDKSKAEEIAKGFKNRGVKAFVTEADLKEKGIYYRVKAGPFSSSEEAKQKMSGLE